MFSGATVGSPYIVFINLDFWCVIDIYGFEEKSYNRDFI